MENKYSTAKVAFLYCLSMVVLGFLASGVGTALFGLIDKLIPQVAINYYSGGLNGAAFKYAISAIIIAAPLYYWLTYLLRRGLVKGEYSSDSGPRRWLTYLLLLVSSVTIVGSLVRLLYSFLDGDLTTRFTLKAVSVLVIAALVFGYYFYDLKNDAKKGDWIVRVILGLSLVLVIGSFVASIVYSESPKMARARRNDQQTLTMLDRTESSINIFYQKNKKLPKDMDELIAQADGNLLAVDLENKDNGAKVDYKFDKGDKYQLCAKFETVNTGEQLEYDYLGRRWQHKEGDNCFAKTAVDLNDAKNVTQ